MAMPRPKPPPKLFCIRAKAAPIIAVLRRGSSKWWHVIKWNLTTDTLEHGAWTTLRMHPTACSLSDDGQFLIYCASKYGRDHGDRDTNPFASWLPCTVASRLPWLSVLAAVGQSAGKFALPPDQVRKIFDSDDPYIVWKIPVFANEVRRGWLKSPATQDDAHLFQTAGISMIGERATVLRIAHAGMRLVMVHKGFEEEYWSTQETLRPSFVALRRDGEPVLLERAVWADIDDSTVLVAACDDGRLRRWSFDLDSGALTVLSEHDLNGLRPAPAPAPDWATAPLEDGPSLGCVSE